MQTRLVVIASFMALTGAIVVAEDWDHSRLLLVGKSVHNGVVSDVGNHATLKIKDNGSAMTIRLQDIVIPEKDPNLAMRAGKQLRSELLGVKVEIHVLGYSPDGTPHGYVIAGGEDARIQLLEGGLAWYCPTHGRVEELANAENQARQATRGIWGTSDRRSCGNSA